MNKPTILITGGNGQVAWDLKQEIQSWATIASFSKEGLNITEAESILNVIKREKPLLLVNTAAYTAVDKAEQEIEHVMQANAHGPSILAKICEQYKIPLIHLSTDYVFDGQKKEAYQEDDDVNPINVYGVSKWEGEEEIRKYCEKHLILRVSGVFGYHGHNFVKTILTLAKEQKELKVVADQITCPTPSQAIANTVSILTQQIVNQLSMAWGTYHYCSEPPVSWYHFAQAIKQYAEDKISLNVETIHPISTEEFPRPAKRPLYSVLSNQKIKRQFNIETPSWQKGIEQLIDSLL
ncbi:MAG: dTDP-4-dehydrorhamnose reductase [Legionellaceae bacterium]